MAQQPDIARSYYLYRYLLGCLAINRKLDGALNSTQTAQRVGEKELRKVLPAILSGDVEWHERASSSKSKVTTGILVEMLSKLRTCLNEEYATYDEPYSRVLTTEDVLTALYQLVELAPEERDRLGLPAGDMLTLLKQTLLSLQTRNGTENYESIFRAYKEAVGLEFVDNHAVINTLDQVNELIEASVRAALDYLPNRSSNYKRHRKQDQSKEDTIIELTRKAQREVRRLLVRSGNTQPSWIDRTATHPYISHYLPPAFVKKTVANRGQ